MAYARRRSTPPQKPEFIVSIFQYQFTTQKKSFRFPSAAFALRRADFAYSGDDHIASAHLPPLIGRRWCSQR
jgi:hypothetical protein